MKIVYAGVMQSEVGNYNGFGKAMAGVCDEYVEIPMSGVNAGLQGLKQADIVFLQPQSEGISAETLQHLKSIGAWVCNWTGDARDVTPVYCYDYARCVDLTCFSNMRDVHNMRSIGHKSEFLQIGFDENIYYPDDSIEKTCDIAFMANNYGHFPLSGLRKQLVIDLKRVYGDRFKSYGIGMSDGSFMGNQQGEADIYRRAKIGINLSHYDYERYTSDRMFRLLGSGVCVLSKYYPGIEYDFVDGNQLIVWNDINDLINKIDICLRGNNSIMAQYNMKALADRGHQCATNHHTFKNMAENILKLYLNNK